MLVDPAAYICGYGQLSALGVGFYPVHSDKSPAVQGRLDRAATIDPIKISFWVESCHHRSFAARLLRGSRLLVVDTENPFKHADRIGPDGELFLGSLLEDCQTTLPPCPFVQTASGGFHRYLVVPRGHRIRPTVTIWPGIDVLAAGSSVILPGSRTEAGEYRAVRTFDECPIPEAPRAFVSLIRKAQKATLSHSRRHSVCSDPFAEVETSDVSRRQWWLLFRNRVFRSFWRRQGKAGDATDSAYEYHLAKACFCCGLNHRQAESVVVNWRRKHALDRDLRQLRRGILPRAWSEVEPWVERWNAELAAADELRRATKTSNQILAHMSMAESPHTPALVATALGLSRECIKKSMQRLAKDGKLLRTPAGYRLP